MTTTYEIDVAAGQRLADIMTAPDPTDGLWAELHRAAATYAEDPAGLVDLLAEEREALDRVMKWAGPHGDEPESDDPPRLSDPSWLQALLDAAVTRARRALEEDAP